MCVIHISPKKKMPAINLLNYNFHHRLIENKFLIVPGAEKTIAATNQEMQIFIFSFASNAQFDCSASLTSGKDKSNFVPPCNSQSYFKISIQTGWFSLVVNSRFVQCLDFFWIIDSNFVEIHKILQ